MKFPLIRGTFYKGWILLWGLDMAFRYGFQSSQSDYFYFYCL